MSPPLDKHAKSVTDRQFGYMKKKTFTYSHIWTDYSTTQTSSSLLSVGFPQQSPPQNLSSSSSSEFKDEMHWYSLSDPFCFSSTPKKYTLWNSLFYVPYFYTFYVFRALPINVYCFWSYSLLY